MQTVAVFDINGTILAAPDPLHRAAFEHALRAVHGFDASLAEVPLAGRLDRVLARELAAAAGVAPRRIDERMDQVMATMGRYYERRIGPGARVDAVLPGTTDLLRHLRAAGVGLGVVTGGARLVARAKLAAAGLDQVLADGAYGDEHDDRAELVRLGVERVAARGRSRVPTAAAVVIGDTPADIDAARRAGARVVAVATGRYSVDALSEHGPDAVFADLVNADAVAHAVRGINRLP
ncbi:MAG: haloacid dehalogenase-like hydrolase [Actinomycetota bacterium]|nr:haloacid dehalogenase-like hydrolase [Actinomycetota bacterium]